jgi:hypothetical protein
VHLFSYHSYKSEGRNKYDLCTKLWLRRSNDCFWVCLLNTKRSCAQHNPSLQSVDDIILKVLALSDDNIPDSAVHADGVTDTEMKLEDED